MKKKRLLIRLTAAGFSFAVVFCLWYSIAANYDYGALAGTYRFHGNEEICMLRLEADGTFQQEIARSGGSSKSQGHWHRYGLWHVSFSGEFQILPGEELNAAGEAHGQFEKFLGIFPELVLAPLANGPKFHRVIFHSPS